MGQLDETSPYFYHPTNTIFVDDNEHFLHTIQLDLSEKINLNTYSRCEKAISIIHASHEFDLIKQLIFHTNNEETTSSSQVTELNLNHLHQIIYNASRFQQTAVIVVDYQMPEMNGIEFCKQIQNPYIMKILLTAEVDTDTAIAAFNQGIIHQYMLKKDDRLNEKLLSVIVKLQKAYFNRLSELIADNVNADFLASLSDSSYLQLFEKAKQQSKAVEYYLLDKFGSMLFLDESATPTWLICRDEVAMQEYTDIAKEQEAPESIIEALNSRKKLLFQLTEKDMQQPIKQWQNYLFDAKTFDNQRYYSVIQSRTDNAVNWDMVQHLRCNSM